MVDCIRADYHHMRLYGGRRGGGGGGGGKYLLRHEWANQIYKLFPDLFKLCLFGTVPLSEEIILTRRHSSIARTHFQGEAFFCQKCSFWDVL